MAMTLFGLPPTIKDAREISLGKDFVRLLSDQLGMHIGLRVGASYSELSDDIAEGRIDFAWLPPLDALRLAEQCGVTVLAQAVRAGQHHYYSVLFTPQDSAVERVEDLTGSRVAFVHRRSASGYLVAASFLSQQGVRVAEPRLFLGSHAAVVGSVLGGQAVAGATHCTFAGEPPEAPVVQAGWSRVESVSDDSVRILAVAGKVPSDVICAWPGTSLGLRQRMHKVLIELGESAPGGEILTKLFGADRFSPLDEEGFASLARQIEARIIH